MSWFYIGAIIAFVIILIVVAKVMDEEDMKS